MSTMGGVMVYCVLNKQKCKEEGCLANNYEPKTECFYGEIRDCGNCQHLDEVFGDCCHPSSGGCLDLRPARDNCTEANDMAWWKKKN